MITVTDPLNRRTSYAYDAVSNQRTDAQGIATTYSYDLRYLPTGVQYPDDVLITNSYDAICQQTVKNANDALTTYTWDAENRMRSADDINSLFAHYTDFPSYWGGLSSLALPTGSFTQVAGMGAFNAVQFNQANFNQNETTIEVESHFYLFDLQSSNRLLLDTNAAKDNEYLYKAFGEKVLSTGTTRNPFQFQGQVGPYFDANNRTWMRARIYNPIAGRWFSQDPIEFEGEDWNLYRFVESQPVNNNDPSGLYSKRELFNAWFCYLKRRLAYDNKTVCCLTNRRVNSHFNCENPINYKIDCLAENNQNVPPWWPKNVPPPKLPTECQKRNANCDSCQSHFYNECLKKKARGVCRQIATGCEILCNSSWDGWKIAACWKGIKKAIPKE